MTKAIVLLSGGQDSTTCLYWTKAAGFEVTKAVSVDYGQRHRAELEAAKEIAELAGVPHLILSMPFLGEIGDSALVGADPIEASGGRVDSEMPEGLPTSFVPGRNLLLLGAASAVAVKVGASRIVAGVCQTDYSGYPDCRRKFVDAFERAATLAMPSSAGPIRVYTPLMQMTKVETVKLAKGFPGCWEALALTVTCYEGKRPGCGECPACKLRRRGFEEAGERDPAG